MPDWKTDLRPRKSAAPSRISTRLIRIGMPGAGAGAGLACTWAAGGPARADRPAFAALAVLALPAAATPACWAPDFAAADGGAAPAGRSISETFRLPLAPMITRP